MDKLYIVIPAYNEEDNIEAVVRDWHKVLSCAHADSKLVVADSGSTDNTHKKLEDLNKEIGRIEILSNTRKEHGPKLIAMYKYAIESGADYVFQTDSDGQTVPSEFYPFWNLRKDYDVVLGNRVVRGDGAIRKFIENIVCLLLRIIFGVKVQDANVPFRLMKASVLNKYVGRFRDDYNIPNIMLTAFFAYYKESMTFREITFKSRQAGTNSISVKKIIKIGINAISDFVSFKKTMKKQDG